MANDIDRPLVPCAKHGASQWCYETPEGHIDSTACCCGPSPSLDCPVHRHQRLGVPLPVAPEESSSTTTAPLPMS